MNDQEYRQLAAVILPKVARCIPAPEHELSLCHAHHNEIHDCARATVYWQSLYVCEAEIKEDGTLVLHSWRPMYADRGRLEYPPEQPPALGADAPDEADADYYSRRAQSTGRFYD